MEDDRIASLPRVTLRLQFPIRFENGWASAVQVRPLYESERSLHPDNHTAAVQDMARATGLPEDAILELDQLDWDRLWAAFWPLVRAVRAQVLAPQVEAHHGN